MQRTRQTEYLPSGCQCELENGFGVSSAVSNSLGRSPGSKMLHSMLAVATPKQQKHILGKHLYPLVQKLKATPIKYSLFLFLFIFFILFEAGFQFLKLL